MIEAAAILFGIVHHWSDLIIIMVLLIANAIVGFWEEYQAGNTIAALKAKLAPHARVKLLACRIFDPHGAPVIAQRSAAPA